MNVMVLASWFIGMPVRTWMFFIDVLAGFGSSRSRVREGVAAGAGCVAERESVRNGAAAIEIARERMSDRKSGSSAALLRQEPRGGPALERGDILFHLPRERRRARGRACRRRGEELPEALRERASLAFEEIADEKRALRVRRLPRVCRSETRWREREELGARDQGVPPDASREPARHRLGPEDVGPHPSHPPLRRLRLPRRAPAPRAQRGRVEASVLADPAVRELLCHAPLEPGREVGRERVLVQEVRELVDEERRDLVALARAGDAEGRGASGVPPRAESREDGLLVLERGVVLLARDDDA